MNTPGKPPNPHGIVEDDRGQDQPADKSRAQDVTSGKDAEQKPRRPARRVRNENENDRSAHRKKDNR